MIVVVVVIKYSGSLQVVVFTFKLFFCVCCNIIVCIQIIFNLNYSTIDILT